LRVLGHPTRGLGTVLDKEWDFVVTVCDRARESRPLFPGQPMIAHWGMPDPAEVEGTDQEKRRAFSEASLLINRRIDLLLALPMLKLERLALEQRVRAIGDVGALESSPPEH
jgi:arsenate reductase